MQMQDLEIQIRFRTDRTFPVYNRLLLIRKRVSLALHPEIMAVVVVQVSAHRVSVYELDDSPLQSASELSTAVQDKRHSQLSC